MIDFQYITAVIMLVIAVIFVMFRLNNIIFILFNLDLSLLLINFKNKLKLKK